MRRREDERRGDRWSGGAERRRGGDREKRIRGGDKENRSRGLRGGGGEVEMRIGVEEKWEWRREGEGKRRRGGDERRWGGGGEG